MSTEPSDLPTIVTDRYTIEKQIGAGGMATVYLARDSKHDREVALKVLRPELGAVLGADRFLAEIKITARLDHPHILTLIDSGAAEGLLYYVLPYVRGESLRDMLTRETQLSIEDALSLTKQVGSALDYAHRHDVIHRDIKPENILIQEGEAILTDFGIALAVKEAGGSRLTQTGLSLGTPMYMSPEQATGERTVGPKSDQYSLAAVLYEMLTGEPPLSGASSQVIIAKLLTEEPTRIRTVRKTVPPGVDGAVAKALAKSPADRFGSIGDFLRALDVSKSATGADVAASSKRRNPLVLGAAAAAVVAVAAAGWFALGKDTVKSAPIAFRDRTQLTFSGSVIAPAITSDGKQLAYFVRSCPTEICTYAMAVQDVGSTDHKVILDGISAAYGLEWSPDRRNILFLATYDGRYGSFLVSALGGTPRRVGPNFATFYSGGDSIVVSGAESEPDKDSTYTLKVTGLSGDVGGTWKVPGGGQGILGLASIPNSNRIVVGTGRGGKGLWQILERDGTSRDQVLNTCTCGGRASVDGVWLARAGPTSAEAVVRIAIDPASGRFAEKQDTLYSGRFTGFSVNADGTQFVVDDGTTEYNATAATIADMRAGKFDGTGTVKSSSDMASLISPDGNRLLKLQSVPDGRGSFTFRLSVVPFEGGRETPLEADGRVLGSEWADSVSVAMATLQESGISLSVVDVRTGARRNQLKLSDSVISGVAPLPNGWVHGTKTFDRLVIAADGKKREVMKSPWHRRINGIAVSPDHSRIMYWGWNAGTQDSMGYVVVPLNGGAPTHVFTTFAEGAGGAWLSDGSFVARVWETPDAVTLTKLRIPGGAEPPIRIPHVSYDFSHSADLQRATLVWRDRKADAFMYRVVKE